MAIYEGIVTVEKSGERRARLLSAIDVMLTLLNARIRSGRYRVTIERID